VQQPEPRPELTAAIYDSLVAFNKTNHWPELRLAQIRRHLAEHLAADLASAPAVSSAGPAPALPPLLAAARALELDRDAASTGESRDYQRGMTRAVKVLRLLNEDEPAGPAPATDWAALAGLQPDPEYAIDIDADGRRFARVLFAFEPSVEGGRRMALVDGITRAVDGARFGTESDWSPATDQADLRELVAEALLTTRRTDYEGAANHRQHRYDARCALCAGDVDALADAVLAVLPAITDRAAERAEVDWIIEHCPEHGCVEPETDVCHCVIAERLRRLADETPQPEAEPANQAEGKA